MPGQRASADTPFDALHTLLATARDLARRLSEDPQLERLVRAFQSLPEHDREPILQVIEKDAAWRRIAGQTAGATGVAVRPNPHASLYVHVLNPVEGLALDQDATQRDADVIRYGLSTFVQLIPLLFQPGVHAHWTTAAREIATGATAEVRSFALQLAREVQAIVAETGAPGDVSRR
jgi:hypothetical protein